MVFAAFWVAVGLLAGAVIWVPITIGAMKRDMADEVDKRVRMALRYR